MSGRLYGARLKIKRAQAHLYKAECLIETFAGQAFKSVTKEHDSETGEGFFVLHELRRPDLEISLSIGDVLNNLRSALDHLAFQLVKRPVTPSAETPSDDHQIAFPICDDPNKFEAAKWRIRGAHPAAQTLIEQLQPYPGRTSPFTFQPSNLALLRKLNDWDKHRLLHVIESELSAVGFLNSEHVETWSARDPGRLEAPAELARYKVGPGIDPEVDVGFYLVTDVTFEGGPADGRGVKYLLATISYEVSSIVERLAEFVAP